MYSERRIVRKDSRKLVAEFFDQCEQLQSTEIPTTPLGKAIAYSLNQRSALEKFLHDPQINIDNNPAENVIRSIALGRKNWLFAGNEEGGMNLAILASFAAICHRNNINFSKWQTVFCLIFQIPQRHRQQIFFLTQSMGKTNCLHLFHE